MFFYELHEGDDDVFTDALLASEEEIAAEDFFDLVQSVRHQVQGSMEADTLSESIALELERRHGFLYISDERLHAAVNVSTVDAENFLVAVDEEAVARADYRGLFVTYADEDELPD